MFSICGVDVCYFGLFVSACLFFGTFTHIQKQNKKTKNKKTTNTTNDHKYSDDDMTSDNDNDKIAATVEPSSIMEPITNVSMFQTVKILYIDLAAYMIPLFGVYFVYNIILGAYISTSYEQIDPNTNLQDASLKVVFQYFILSARIGVFLGKASPTFFHVRQYGWFFYVFIFGLIYAMLLAYAPDLMNFFIFSSSGHWISWIIAIPLGFAYGATCM